MDDHASRQQHNMSQTVIPRAIDLQRITRLMEIFPVTAILGARQCGKTTMAGFFDADHLFDLENPRDMARLETPQLALEDLTGLIVIDEIQRLPDLFPLLRHLVDTIPDQKYLILGSASRQLLRQGSESLAGRIGLYHLGCLHTLDFTSSNDLWLRGGYPRALLAKDDPSAFLWLEHYITTFLEQDIPALGISIPARTLHRFWSMLSHYHGQLLNYSELSTSFGISDMTARKYLDILAGTFMVRTLQPWHPNVSKRLVKRPKLYIRDSGLFHLLMGIDSMDALLGHPKLGASWEGFALENVCFCLGKREEELAFYRTHGGAELDLFWKHGGRNWGVEFKFADAPRKTKSMDVVREDLNLAHLWVVYPGRDRYRLSEDITVLPLRDIRPGWEYGSA